MRPGSGSRSQRPLPSSRNDRPPEALNAARSRGPLDAPPETRPITPTMPLLLQDHVRPAEGGRRRDPLPLLKTAYYTLDISVRFLAAAALGRGSVEYGDRLLDGYWR